MKKFSLIVFLTLLTVQTFAQNAAYQKPPKDVLDVLNASAIPATSISPAKDKILLIEPMIYPSISELSQPMLRIAGLRINPLTNGSHRQPYAVKLALKNIEGGTETAIDLPSGSKVIAPQWSADGKYIAAGNVTQNGVELWIIETATGKAKALKNVKVNTAFGGYSWMPDGKSLMVNLVPSKRGAAPNYQNITPTSPSIQETTGKKGSLPTYQDLLKSPNDELLFDYYATSQLAVVGVDGKIKEVGQPAIFDQMDASPDGKYILTARIHRPFSYLLTANDFPTTVEVWDTDGKSIYKVAEVPMQDNIPVNGVTTAPRNYEWIPTEAATLIWAEALDGGNPKTKAEFRDKLMKIAAPFSDAPSELVKIEQRFAGASFGEKDGLMLFSDFNRDSRHRRIFMTDYRNPTAPKLISDLNAADRYNDIGQPVTKRLPNNFSVIQQNGDEIFLTGLGASPEGDKPFLRKMNLKDLKPQEIWRSTNTEFESFVALKTTDGMQFITRKESPLDPPNLYLRKIMLVGIGSQPTPKQLTDFADPAPQLRGITKKLVKYKRADGVDLSFTLYLPPNYKEGTKLPTVVWAYPLEFTNSAVAGQVSGSTNRFTNIGGYSHLFFALMGYAVLDNATMPIVGDNDTKNDTFVQQINDGAKAAIDKAVEMGVTDPERVGVGGHSYGAFMTANLLAHSDLFRAGIARSGAYNRTLTPFGFQGEIRNFWEATKLYTDVSPFFFADKINEPILLIHGEADNNTGTYPIQSERLFAALQGTGGTARLVMLPGESHGYTAKESTEHTLFEMISWFDKYVKNAKPREKNQAAKQ
ncbi:MAG: prolyl oligopeptidase family serine peptidase [Pyrinomonadaceae bacterium]|nr:prolyl oligopeptidase family serine peptidase [Pyrinomonadaceae bacterium]